MRGAGFLRLNFQNDISGNSHCQVQTRLVFAQTVTLIRYSYQLITTVATTNIYLNS